MGSAGGRMSYGLARPQPPAAVTCPTRGSRSDPELVTIPPNSRVTVRVNLLALKQVEVAVENLGPGAVDVVHPDGRVPAPNVVAVADAKTRLRLSNIDDLLDEIALTITSAQGATVKIWAAGTPRKMTWGEWSVAMRDPQSGLITRTYKTVGLVPAP